MPADRSILFNRVKGPWVGLETLKAAEGAIIAYPYMTIVEMAPVQRSASGILIAGTEHDELRQRPDIGTVLAVGDGVALLPGDIVLVDHSHGKRMVNFQAGDYRAADEVRLYGAATRSGGKVERVAWWRSILAEVVFEDTTITLKPTGSKVLIDTGRDISQTMSGVHFPDGSVEASTGTVVSHGPRAAGGIYAGLTVAFKSADARPVKGFVTDGKKKNYYIVDSADCLFGIKGEAVWPLGDKVMIDRGEVVDNVGGVLLSKGASYRPTIGTIVDKGPDVQSFIKNGAKVAYQATGIKPIKSVLGIEFDGSKFDKNWAVIEEAGIFCEIAEKVAA